MTTTKRLRGEMLSSETSTWQPLLDLVGEQFMWMFEVELEDGCRLHAYKHRWTRRYIHLTSDGRAFVYEEPDSYHEVDPYRMLELVLEPLKHLWTPFEG